MWDLRYERDGWSIEAGLAKGRQPPQWFYEEPDVFPGDEFYVEAFRELSTTRQIGMGLGPIPWNHIAAYAQWSRLDRENTLALSLIIREMDNAYLDWHDKEAEKNKGED